MSQERTVLLGEDGTKRSAPCHSPRRGTWPPGGFLCAEVGEDSSVTEAPDQGGHFRAGGGGVEVAQGWEKIELS